MPITTSLVPAVPARVINSLSMGTSASPPSNEKRFAPGNFAPRYFSRPSAAIKPLKISVFSSTLKLACD